MRSFSAFTQRAFSAAVAGGLLLTAAGGAARAEESRPSIDSVDLAALLEKDGNLLIVDLRPAGEFVRGHLPLAASVPWDGGTVAKKRLALLTQPPARSIVLYGLPTLALVELAADVQARNGGRVSIYPAGIEGWLAFSGGYLEIEWDGVWEMLVRERPYVLDFRDAEAFAAGHIPGAEPAPESMLALKRLEKSPWAKLLGNRPVIAYCDGAGCGISRKAARRLSELGVKRIYQFPGGWPEFLERTQALE